MITSYILPEKIENPRYIKHQLFENKNKEQVKSFFDKLNMIEIMYFCHLILNNHVTYEKCETYDYLKKNYNKLYLEYLEYTTNLCEYLIHFNNNNFTYIENIIYDTNSREFKYKMKDNSIIDCCNYDNGFEPGVDLINKFTSYYNNIRCSDTFALVTKYFIDYGGTYMDVKSIRDILKKNKSILIEIKRINSFARDPHPMANIPYIPYNIFNHNYLYFFNNEIQIIVRNDILTDLLEED